MKHFSPLPWRIKPLDGKYYGTDIVDANGREVCTLWNHSHEDPDANLPSSRERERNGPFDSEEGWWNFWKEYCCDSHYESAGDLAAAELILSAVNRPPQS